MKCHWCEAPAAVYAEGESLGLLGKPFVPRSRVLFCDEHKNEQRTTDLIDSKGWESMALGPFDPPSAAPPVRASDDG